MCLIVYYFNILIGNPAVFFVNIAVMNDEVCSDLCVQVQKCMWQIREW